MEFKKAFVPFFLPGCMNFLKLPHLNWKRYHSWRNNLTLALSQENLRAEIWTLSQSKQTNVIFSLFIAFIEICMILLLFRAFVFLTLSQSKANADPTDLHDRISRNNRIWGGKFKSHLCLTPALLARIPVTKTSSIHKWCMGSSENLSSSIWNNIKVSNETNI